MKPWIATTRLLDRIVAAGWMLERFERRAICWLRARLGIVVRY
ncbi:MAG: hypothetical protein ACK5KM_06955 [Hyphomicrobiaceae bacterium]